MTSRFQSPLLGTLLVVAALSVLAIPLHRLTARQEIQSSEEPAADSPQDRISSIVRIRALETLHEFKIETEPGNVIYQSATLDAGETEIEADLDWHNQEIHLILTARAGDRDTAVFVTVMPDAYEERMAHVIGSGQIEEEMHFQWTHP